ncbi:cellobiose transport system substrate-binding protein [Kineococcus radiotolerans]|uniref:Cellobiose transport system substrate-binding protein n=1 Tax=Kineococcus radiotolerans TaxID=131568 RepID=A0A7W4TM83_KINRA|nr:extracellular solute-binding protein [Kineococcus radiotolerans]MBB2901108.1 cellobiose transport system substrate-binding protein [Kineococcus radiotolerans]
MLLSRRNLLLSSGLAALGAGVLSACSTSGTSGGGTGGGAGSGTALWYWGGGLSDAVVAAAGAQFPDAGLAPSVVGGDFKQKLQTTLTGGSFIPQITGVKGEDMPFFRSVADKFTDLNELGAQDIASTQLAWKWAEAQTADGKQLGFPIDIGPTAMFYRQDVLAQAGLPTDPAAVAAATSTWDAFYAFGQELHAKVPGSFPVGSLATVFQIVVGQISQRFVSEDDTFVGDGDEMKQAWDTTVRAQALGINANAAQDKNSGLASGLIAVEMGAAWGALDIKSAAPDTAGAWRVTNNPVKPTNFGGSFLTIPAATEDKEAAFEIIQWILSTDNQAKAYTDASIFPADPAAWELPALTGGDDFFGGQKTIDVFGPAGRLVPEQYVAAADSAVSAPYYNELTNVETAGKDPEQAWNDAVAAARDIADRQGVK